MNSNFGIGHNRPGTRGGRTGPPPSGMMGHPFKNRVRLSRTPRRRPERGQTPLVRLNLRRLEEALPRKGAPPAQVVCKMRTVYPQRAWPGVALAVGSAKIFKRSDVS